MHPYDHAQHGSELFVMFVVLGIIGIGAWIISLVVDLKLDIRKQDNDRLIGRERNDAFRDVASARLTASEQAESAKAATLEAAEVKLNFGELSTKYEKAQEALAIAMARIEELEQKSTAPSLPEKPAGVSFVIGADGELGDPTFSEELFDDASSIIFHKEDEVPVS